jgi:hypothetical protein
MKDALQQKDVVVQLPSRVWSLLLLLLLFAVTRQVCAQCPVSNPDDDVPPPLPLVESSTRSGEPQIPESGHLTNNSYANTYFGFVMELPLAVEGHRIMLPLMPPGQHALLALGFQDKRHSGTLLITASEPAHPLHEMTDEERRAEQLAWAKGQPRHDITPPDWVTRTGRFYHIAQHTSETTAVQYWTFIKNYLIRVKVVSNDAAFLRSVKDAVSGVKFYCAQDDGTLIDDKGKPVATPGEGYRGPTIPTSVVDAALDEKPALEQIARGEVGTGMYRNEDMGLVYTYPTTWEAAKDQTGAAPPKDEIAQRTRDVLDACSLMLLQLAPQNPASRLITLRAIDQTCLGLPAPASVTDRYGAEELGAYLQMLGVLGELRETGVAMHGDHTFAEYSGLIGQRSEGQSLAHRQAEAVAVTRHRKLLLVWSWIAADTAELAGMPKVGVSFEGAPAIELGPAAVMAKR